MTSNQNRQIQRLLKLAELTQEFESVDLQLVNHFCELREQYGLAKLLLQIEDHVRNRPNQQNQPHPQPHQTSNSNQDPHVVQ